MKKNYFLFISVALLVAACGSQNVSRNKVPSLVLNTLKAKYPDTDHVDWKKQGNLYEVELDINDSVEIAVLIDDAGKFIMQKQDVADSELPAGIITAMQNQHKDYRVDDVEKIDKGGAVYYQVELKAKGKKELNKVLSADGNEEKTIAYWD